MPQEKKPLRFKKTSALASPEKHRLKDWRILVVDDDDEVHSVTRLILGKVIYKERGIELLAAHSAAEARLVIEKEHDIAVILLDVVMESDNAGLELVREIREQLKNQAVRIILRTGQPGQAPEERVIVDYDINDYKAKSELTAQKLFTTVIAALRSYETIVSLEKTRQGLEKILDSTSTLFQIHSFKQFASGVLCQLSEFLGCKPNGVICLQLDQNSLGDEMHSCSGLEILAVTGEYSDCMTCPMDGTCKHEYVLQLVRKALTERKMQLTEEFTVFYFESGNTQATAALMHDTLGYVDERDRRLLEVFSSKISIALANALNYQKMISAETAATTDFLTGLDNRRQLLRIGVPLVAGAFRAGTPLAVAMLDIDYFKHINDTFGHDAGDEVLKYIATQLRERFRASDVVSRFGGEEFCIIAANITGNGAHVLFDNFRRSLEEQLLMIHGQAVKLTISIGVTSTVVESLDAMISMADDLLYQAKHDGRNRVVLK